MEAKVEFVDGLIVKAPHEKAPDFVKAAISIKVNDLKKWLSDRDEEWVNLDVKEAKSGKWYASVSTFKKEEKPSKVEQKNAPASSDIDDLIPF